jgi:hypothetical protein
MSSLTTTLPSWLQSPAQTSARAVVARQAAMQLAAIGRQHAPTRTLLRRAMRSGILSTDYTMSAVRRSTTFFRNAEKDIRLRPR